MTPIWSKVIHGFDETSYISNFITLLLFILFTFYFLPLLAQSEISDSLVLDRIQHIQKTLSKDKRDTQFWWYGWLFGYGAATIGQGTIAYLSHSKSTKQDMILGAGTTSLGVIGQFTSPVIPNNVSDSLEHFSEDNPENLLIKIDRAEELMEKVAYSEKVGRSWKTHAVCSVVNLSSGLITWLGFKRTIWDGVANFAFNTAITELQIWTQPNRAMKDYKSGCRRYKECEKVKNWAYNPKWSVGIGPGTFIVKFEF